MSETITAIETSYKGYRFRSRLEARWAVFFDELGLKWNYESEGFVLPDGSWYLPDFRVIGPQGMLCWYEVKPSDVKSDSKFSQFAGPAGSKEYKGLPVHYCLLSGDPLEFLGPLLDEEFSGSAAVCPRCGAIGKPDTGLSLFRPFECDWGLEFGCWPCDHDTPSGGGHDAEIGAICACRPHKGWIVIDGGNAIDSYLLRLRDAATKARSIRFEVDR